MATRSAVDTIKGYLYQFDKTILEILGLPDDGFVTVERIEDVDVDTPTESIAIQCKHVPSAAYCHSTIRKPVTLMLESFVARGKAGLQPVKYILYAHYAEPGIHKQLSLAELKDVLTYTEKKVTIAYHDQHGITDAELIAFLDQFDFLEGPSFEDQQEATLLALEQHFGCARPEADLVYYNNAIRAVRDLSVSKIELQRRTTRAEFIAKIDTKLAIFDSWYLQLRSEKEYTVLAKERISTVKGLSEGKKRLVFLGLPASTVAGGTVDLGMLVEQVVKEYYWPGKVLANAQPITFVVDAPPAEIRKAKLALLANGIEFNDGHEEIGFQPQTFNRPPVTNRQLSKGAQDPKLGKASYLVRLVSKHSYVGHLAELEPPDRVMYFSREDPGSYLPSGGQPVVLPLHAKNIEAVLKILRKGK